MKQKKSLVVVVSLAAVIVILLLGIGGKRYMDSKKMDTNLENQRKAALALKKEEPQATKIVFTSEGSHPGIGIPWTVGAEVTMDGEVFNMSVEADGDYSINLGKDEDNYKSNKLKEIKNKKIVEHNLEVIYSDGKSEEIK